MPDVVSRFDFFNFNDIEKNVNFLLYTVKNKEEPNSLNLDTPIELTPYDHKKETKLIVHGWMASGKSDMCLLIKDEYLKFNDYNVIIVDWSAIARNMLYPIPMYNTKNVGKYIAKFIDFLIEHGSNPDNIHVIGHSLGAHVAAFAGENLTKGKLGRVTGLDPAYPGFHDTSITGGRLSPSCASFVDVIHTCAGILGLTEPVGTADFYPNSGNPPQPGCNGLSEVKYMPLDDDFSMEKYLILFLDNRSMQPRKKLGIFQRKYKSKE